MSIILNGTTGITAPAETIAGDLTITGNVTASGSNSIIHTAANTPMFSAWGGTDLALTSSVQSANIIFTNTSVNVTNSYSTTTGIFTVPVAGMYLFTAATRYQTTSTLTAFYHIMLKNGGNMALTQAPLAASSAGGAVCGSSFMSYCAVGDHISLQCVASGAGSLTMTRSIGEALCNLQGVLLARA